MRPHTFFYALLVVVPLCPIPAATSHAQVLSTFDSSLEGWKVIGDNGAAFDAMHGHPAGSLSVNDLAFGSINYAVAPKEYHGDWSHLTASDYLSVDIFHSSSDPEDIPAVYIFRIAGPGHAAQALGGQPIKDVWNHYSVPMDPSAWRIEKGTWADLLSNVNSLRICGEFTDGYETCRIDNVYLSSAPVETFDPCVSDDFNDGTIGDWSFSETDGVSNPGTTGNGGGFIRVADGTGISKAYAPAKFLGNWSSLNNNGYITIDIRVLDPDTPDLGVGEFIRLSGPGGVAHVDLDPADLPHSKLIWKTFVVPLTKSTWTMDSGAWNGLLAEVTECRITVEYYNGSETIGIDNFGRLSFVCPPIDDTVRILDPNVNLCGYHSFVYIASVAANPMDDELYGLVASTPANGGGIYPITGPGAGVRTQAYDRPAHLIFDTDGDAYISERYAGEVHRLEWGGASSLWVSDFRPEDDDPCGMAFAPAAFDGPNVDPGDILVVDEGYGTDAYDGVYSFSADVAEGELLLLPDPGDYDFYDVATGPSSTVYVCDALNTSGLYTLDALGTLTPVSMTTPVDAIYSVVYDSVEDDIYIASAASLGVYRVEPSTGVVTLVADGFQNFLRCCLEIDAARRRLWVADNGYSRVYELCLGAQTAVDDGPSTTARALSLGVFPNPFNPSATIRLVLDRTSHVRLEVFDVSGRRVRTLFDDKRAVGLHEFMWDGRDARRQPCPSGVYFIRIATEDHVDSIKAVLVK